MKAKRMDTLMEWPYESCKLCGNRVIPGFDVSDDIWKKVIGKELCVCLACFDREAQKKGIYYEINNIFIVSNNILIV